MKIYFAGSVRGGRNDKDVYALVIKKLQVYGTVLTEHIGDASLTAQGEKGKTPEFIYKRDIEWVRDADALVAEVTQPSLGVGYEVAKAEEWGKQILCLYRPSKDKLLSSMILGSSVTVKEYTDIDELDTIFKEFFT